MKFIDSVMSPGITPSWVSKKIIETHLKEVKDGREKEKR